MSFVWTIFLPDEKKFRRFWEKSLKLRGQGDHREALPVVNVIKLFSLSGQN
jgi:hypothetical protein